MATTLVQPTAGVLSKVAGPYWLARLGPPAAVLAAYTAAALIVPTLANVAVTGGESAWDRRQIHLRCCMRADAQVILPAAFCTITAIQA